MPEPQVRTDGPNHGELMRQKLQQATTEIGSVVQNILEQIRHSGIPPTAPPPAL